MLLSRMLSDIAKNVLLLRSKSRLFKRCNIRQMSSYSDRTRWTEIASRNPISENKDDDDDDDDLDKPIKYSTSKAATMRINEYRDPYGDSIPWYQTYVITASLTVFLIYFCILREENDIDELLYTNLEETLNRTKIEYEKKYERKSQ